MVELPYQMVEGEMKRPKELGVLQCVYYIRWLGFMGEFRGFTIYQSNEHISAWVPSPLRSSSSWGLMVGDAFQTGLTDSIADVVRCLTIRGQELIAKVRVQSGDRPLRKLCNWVIEHSIPGDKIDRQPTGCYSRCSIKRNQGWMIRMLRAITLINSYHLLPAFLAQRNLQLKEVSFSEWRILQYHD